MARFFKIVLVFFIFLAGNAFCQNIQNIRNEVQKINLANNYRIEILANDYLIDITKETYDNGQELQGYFVGKQLKKMTHTVGLSAWKIVTEYYFSKEDLIFVHRIKYQIIDENGYLENPEKVGEFRYYVHQKRVFKKLKAGIIEDGNIPDLIKDAFHLKMYFKR